MFGRIFKYQLKMCLRNRQELFWTLIFPIALGTLFFVAFGNIYSDSKLASVKVALEGENNLSSILYEIEYENGGKMLDITLCEGAEAEKRLEEGDICGIIHAEDNGRLSLYLGENGIEQSILSELVILLNKDAALIEEAAKRGQEEYLAMVTAVNSEASFIRSEPLTGDNKDPMVAYFYNLIAMAGLLSSLVGIGVANRAQADLSGEGARVSVSPAGKSVLELGSFLAILLVQVIIGFISLVYLMCVLGIEFGGNKGFIFLTTALAMLLGCSLGFFVGHFAGISKSAKEGILTAFTLGGGFLSGLMYGNMKIILEEKCPIINCINPAAVLTDSFYSLNMYGVGRRYFTDLLYLIILSLIFIIAGIALSVRKGGAYDSI